MRYLLHFTFFLLFCASLTAQRGSHLGEGRSYLQKKGQTTGKTILPDTLVPGIFFDSCSDTLFTIQSDDGGYVAGTNDLLDKEKAQYILLEDFGPLQILGIVGYFAEVDEAVRGRVLRAKLYAVDLESGGPGELLATSEALSVADVQVSDTGFPPTVFTFPSPIASSETELFMSIDFTDIYEVPTGNIGLLSTQDGCGDGFDAWEKWSDDTWHALNEEAGWNLNLAFFIGLIVEEATTATTTVLAGLEAWQVYPNPAAELAHFTFSLTEALPNAHFTVLNGQGQSVYEQNVTRLAAGAHQWSVPVEQLPAGLYFYQLRSPAGLLSGRLLVGRP